MPTSGYGPMTTLMNSRIEPEGSVTLSRIAADTNSYEKISYEPSSMSATGWSRRLFQNSGYGSRTSPATPLNCPIGSNGTISATDMRVSLSHPEAPGRTCGGAHRPDPKLRLRTATVAPRLPGSYEATARKRR